MKSFDFVSFLSKLYRDTLPKEREGKRGEEASGRNTSGRHYESKEVERAPVCRAEAWRIAEAITMRAEDDGRRYRWLILYPTAEFRYRGERLAENYQAGLIDQIPRHSVETGV